MPSKSPSRAKGRKESKSPVKKSKKSADNAKERSLLTKGTSKQETNKKGSLSKSPARAKGKIAAKARSRSASRSRQNEPKSTPKPRGRPRSQSRSRKGASSQEEVTTDANNRNNDSTKILAKAPIKAAAKEALEKINKEVNKLTDGVDKFTHGIFSISEKRHAISMTRQSRPLFKETPATAFSAVQTETTLRRRVADLSQSAPLVRDPPQSCLKRTVMRSKAHLARFYHLYITLLVIVVVTVTLYFTAGKLQKSLKQLHSQINGYLAGIKKQV